MNWGTLSVFQVAALSGAAVALALWLYLRQPRAARLRVSTLRFWESSPSGASNARRRKLREPWALLAQILFLLLLIAALGNPRWGAATQGRDVAIVLDAGAWTQMAGANGALWLAEVRAQAEDLLADLPTDDRVLLIRADSDGSPLVPFTTDRSALRGAIRSLESSSAVADIPRALGQARAALGSGVSAPGTTRGLLVYVGPGLMDEKQSGALDEFRQSLTAEAQPALNGGAQTGEASAAPEFLVRLAGSGPPLQNIGITQMALKRSAGAGDEWGLMTQVKNYNDVPARVALSLSVGGHVFREDQISLAAGATQTAADDFTSVSGGLLQAEITPGDGLAADNRATMVLPSSQPVAVTVVTSRPTFEAKMRAVLSANPYAKTEFIRAGATPPSTADVVIYDGAIPDGATAPAMIAFVLEPADGLTRRVRLTNWNPDHPVTRWIQSRDVSVMAGEALKPGSGDTVLATSAEGEAEPLIVAHDANGRRSVVADFDPLDSNFTEEPAFPLLMAASIEWMTHTVEEQGDFLTAGSVDLPMQVSRVVAPSGRDVLFAGDDSSAHFYAGESGLYQVIASGETLEVPVNVPLLPTFRLTPTAAEAAPLEVQPIAIVQQDLWRWLVGLALIALWLEWRFFYFRREKKAEEILDSAPHAPGSLGIDMSESGRDTESSRPVVKAHAGGENS
jgi:hypothetical protein